MIVNLQEVAERMLADYDAKTPGELVGEPLDLSTAQAYALQARLPVTRRAACGERVIGVRRLYELMAHPGAVGRQGADLRPALRHRMSSFWRASLVCALCQPGSGGRDGGAAIPGLVW